ncbi:MAG: hypothetical protein E6G17_10725 [Actinobacteria bacterium]|nr:MAG: hypothetical protein E6G17_10725 [Actinomycetota bacterium]
MDLVATSAPARAPAATRARAWPSGAVIALCVGLTAVATLRKGAFYTPDVVVLPLAAAALAIVRSRRRLASAEMLLLGFAAWWLLAAFAWGDVGRALPLAGSAVGFAAALRVGSHASTGERKAVLDALVAVGVTVALIGLGGVVFHHYPLAMPAQGLWRLAGPLTYANAAGLLLAISALAATALRGDPRWVRVLLFLLLAALVATLSRGALVSAVAGAAFLGRNERRRLLWPTAVAVASVVAFAATASHHGAQPVVLGAVVVGAVVAALGPPRVGSRGTLALAVGAAAIAVVVVPLALPAIHLRTGRDGVDERHAEWVAASRQFARHPIAGAGPEHLLVLRSHGGFDVARFAHDEPLQVAAGGGLVALALLAGAGRAIASRARRADPLQRAAMGALAAFAVGGLFDFAWHLPGIAMTAGWMAALTQGRSDAQPLP